MLGTAGSAEAPAPGPGSTGSSVEGIRYDVGKAEWQISLEAMAQPSQRVASEVGFEGGVRFGQTKLEGRVFWVGEKWFPLLDEGVTIYAGEDAQFS